MFVSSIEDNPTKNDQYKSNTNIIINNNNLKSYRTTVSIRKQYQTKAKKIANRNVKNIKPPYYNNYLAQVETEHPVALNSNPVALNKEPVNRNPVVSNTIKIATNQKHHPLNSTSIKKKKLVQTNNTVVKSPTKPIASKKKNIDITEQLKELQVIVNNIDTKSKKVSKNNDAIKKTLSHSNTNNKVINGEVDYWQTVYSIESKQGKLLYRPRNKARNCNYTLGPCGHHQLTVQALRDIGCKSLQCRKDRLDFNKSLQLSKKLLALNEKRLKKDGLTNLQGYEKYLIHQQGANGIKNIIAATKGKKELSKTIKKNMANNSPYSYKQYKRMGSKIAAKKFMQHWKKKWIKENRMLLASNNKITKRQGNYKVAPTFNDNDLNFALNMMF